MDEDKISVISIECRSSNENQLQLKEDKDKMQDDNGISRLNICHVFSVLAICIASISVITLVPRTNSIFYQSYWYEFNICIVVLMILLLFEVLIFPVMHLHLIMISLFQLHKIHIHLENLRIFYL